MSSPFFAWSVVHDKREKKRSLLARRTTEAKEGLLVVLQYLCVFVEENLS